MTKKYGYIFKELFRLPLQLSISYKVRNFAGICKKTMAFAPARVSRLMG